MSDVGVAVEDPDRLVAEHHRVRVGVELEERRELLDPGADVALHEDLGLRGDLARDQRVEAAEPERERRARRTKFDSLTPSLPL